MRRPGRIYQYTDGNGQLQKGIAYNDEQTPSVTQYKRVFLRLVDDDYKPKKIDGKNAIAVKHYTELTPIGHVD